MSCTSGFTHRVARMGVLSLCIGGASVFGTEAWSQVHTVNGTSVRPTAPDPTGHTPENNGGTQGGATGSSVGQGVANSKTPATQHKAGGTKAASGSSHDAGASTHSY